LGELVGLPPVAAIPGGQLALKLYHRHDRLGSVSGGALAGLGKREQVSRQQISSISNEGDAGLRLAGCEVVPAQAVRVGGVEIPAT
jgi:hypothetical protein